jgi:hypothetical protein
VNLKIKRFVSDVVTDLVDNGISVKLEHTKLSSYFEGKRNIKCEGWFDEEELVCATKQPLDIWIPVLAHEYSHFRQWKEKSRYYTNGASVAVLDGFLEGTKVKSNQRLTKAINKIQEMELDCEKRSIDLIGRYGLEFDLSLMIQRANAYIWFYSVVQKLGRWYTTPPGMVEQIIKYMPKVFMCIEYYRGDILETSDLFKLYKKYCMKGRYV